MEFSKEGVTLAQIILISAMRCNFNKEIRMEKNECETGNR